MDVRVVKFEEAEPEQRMVWAEVYAPNLPDSDGEFMSAKSIREMAYKFAKERRLDQIDVLHDNQTVKGIHVVESFIARKGDPLFIEDAWVVGIHIDDDATWEKVKKGELNGLSMESMVNREEREVEIEIPAVISGLTHKSDGHDHEFFVTFDENANFRGGTTNFINGHSHVIKRGTVTEMANGHNHRFAAVDTLQIFDESEN